MRRLAEEDQGDVGKGEEPHHDEGESGQVLLHDRRTGEGPPHPTPEGGGGAPTPSGVQEYGRDEGYAENRVGES